MLPLLFALYPILTHFAHIYAKRAYFRRLCRAHSHNINCRVPNSIAWLEKIYMYAYSTHTHTHIYTWCAVKLYHPPLTLAQVSPMYM